MIDGEALTDALLALVRGLPSLAQGTVYDGVPAALEQAVGAYVVNLAASPADKTTGGLIGVDWAYEVTFAYRVNSAPPRAEERLTRLAVELVRAFYTDRTLGGVAATGRWERGPGFLEYRAFAGAETRLYPVFLTLTQYETIPS